jgi:hypothetical protein
MEESHVFNQCRYRSAQGIGRTVVGRSGEEWEGRLPWLRNPSGAGFRGEEGRKGEAAVAAGLFICVVRKCGGVKSARESRVMGCDMGWAFHMQ